MHMSWHGELERRNRQVQHLTSLSRRASFSSVENNAISAIIPASCIFVGSEIRDTMQTYQILHKLSLGLQCLARSMI